MKFNDDLINTDERYAIGREETTGKYYISIPVSNRLVDYDEYYQISKIAYNLFLTSPAQALAFVVECRNKNNDELLIFKPGTDRGDAN